MSRRFQAGCRPHRLTAAKPAGPAIALAVAGLVAGCSAGSNGAGPSAGGVIRPASVSAAQLALLPKATTFGSSKDAPTDPDPFKPETGIVLHPKATLAVYSRPGGPPVAALPDTELGSPTWVPVVQSLPGWDRILLPSRPNRSTGWIYLRPGTQVTAYSSYRIEINLARYRLTVFKAGRKVGSWTVAEGALATPTPTGRTFLLASMAPVHPTYSPLILPLGLHSNTLNSFGGGPGTVALHTWPDPAVFGHAISHGCVRVPPAGLRVLSRIPLGSSVVIVG